MSDDRRELSDAELKGVSGGSEQYCGDWYDKGTSFVTAKHPNEYCTVVFTMPGGLCYTVGHNTAAYTATFATLKPILENDWRDYHRLYMRIHQVPPPEWGVM